MDDIKIKKSQGNRFIVEQGDKEATVVWDELFGLLATMTMPESKYCLEWFTPKPKNDFKDGDFVYVEINETYSYIFIKKSGNRITECYTNCTKNSVLGNCSAICEDAKIKFIRPASNDEKQQLLEVLHKNGKDWDAKNNKLIKYRTIPALNSVYYTLASTGKIVESCWNNLAVDFERWKIGNYFNSRKEASEKLEVFKEVFNG